MTPEPGIHAGVPFAEYLAWDACSASQLKILDQRSAAHLRYTLDHPPESTPAMRLGTALHTRVLEPEHYAESYAVAPECDRRTKVGKATWAEFVEASDGKEVLRSQDAEGVEAMARAVHDHNEAHALLQEGDPEVSLLWLDPDTGVRCKARIDHLTAGIVRTPVDLKTTQDASPDGFSRSLYSFGYYLQAEHYRAGLTVLGIPCDSFAFIAVEKDAPHAVAVYWPDEPTFGYAAHRRGQLLAEWAAYTREGEWPGYRGGEISLPGWAVRKIADELEEAA